MKLLVVRHTAETPPGTTLSWAASRQHEVIEIYAHQLSDQYESVNGMIFCGGEMGVYEERKFPWLKYEKAFIANALAKKIPIVGLCLGGQLLAEVLGGKVQKHKDWEIGWQYLKKNEDPSETLHFPQQFYAFQYHQDVFSLPPQAKCLAHNGWWQYQAFFHPVQALAFQFHPEAEKNWIQECAVDAHLPQTGQSQTGNQMVLETDRHLEATRHAFFSTLDGFFGGSK